MSVGAMAIADPGLIVTRGPLANRWHEVNPSPCRMATAGCTGFLLRSSPAKAKGQRLNVNAGLF
jgi:hypothetical protein